MAKIAISGINLFEGGPLSVFYDCLAAIRSQGIYKENEIIIFVHQRELFQNYMDICKIIELPKSRKNYIFRLYYEYIFFYRFSLSNHIDVWFSLHDITPRVKAERIYTYCHNPSPFIKKDLSKIALSPQTVFFSYLYKYLYRMNIKSATAIIVQQEWMRKAFLERYPIKSVIVAHPKISIDYSFCRKLDKPGKYIFIYAAFPRFFKNYEQLLEAAERLESFSDNFEVWITLSGYENKYAKQLKNKFGHIQNIKWMGLKERADVYKLYDQSDCMIFCSYLETWGLPISEYKESGKPMLLADMPYAHEAIGSYRLCSFFKIGDVDRLVELMRKSIEKTIEYEGHQSINYAEPFYNDWKSLVEGILK